MERAAGTAPWERELTPEERAALDRRQAADLARREREALYRVPDWLARAGVPARLRQPSGAIVPAALREWAADFPGSLPSPGGLIVGPIGTGKTMAAVWTLGAAYCAAWDDPPSARFLTCRDYLDARWDRASRARAAATCRLLVLDEWRVQWGIETREGELLESLVNERWAADRPTLVTTNLPAEHGSLPSFAALVPGAYSRLADRRGVGVVVMRGPDGRLR